MNNLTKVLIAGGAVLVVSTLFARRCVRKCKYDAARKKWLDSFDTFAPSTNKKVMPLDITKLNSERMFTVNEIRSHYDDITFEYFRQLLYTMDNIPNGTESILAYIDNAFDTFKEQLRRVNKACTKAIRAELSLLTDDFVCNSKPKTDIIADEELVCDKQLELRLGYLDGMHDLYLIRARDWSLTDEETESLEELISSFLAA